MTRNTTRAVILAALAGVLVLASVIADRLGASADVVTTLVLLLALFAIVVCGMGVATMRISAFQALGREEMPAGLAVPSVLALGLASLGRHQSFALDPAVVLGLAGAYIAYAVLLAAPLARSGGHSLGDVMAWRFRSRPIAALVAASGLGAVLLGAKLLADAAVSGVVAAAAIDPMPARILITLMLLAALLPGGARSVLAVAAVTLIMAVTGWLGAATSLRFAGQWAEADLLAMPERYFSSPALGAGAVSWFCAALGMLATLHVSVTDGSPEQQRRGYALSALLVMLLALVASIAVAALAQTDALPRVMAAGATMGRGLAKAFGTPVVIGASFDLAIPVVQIALLALLVHCLSRGIIHDVLYRLSGQTGTASGRLALQRLLAASLVLLLVWGGAALPSLAPDGPIVRALLTLVASVPFPLALLALWPRVDWRAAACGIAATAGIVLTGMLDALHPEFGFGAGAGACLAAGAIAAMLFPSQSDEENRAADMMAGRRHEPHVKDISV